jgi:hypothetical protein
MDEQEMADFFYAALKGSKELGVESLNIYVLPLGDLWGTWTGSNFITIGLREPEMPAYRVITSIIGPNTSTSE